MEDAYCDFSDCMHHHACHFQHQMSCSMRQLMSNLTPTSSYQGENNYEEMPVSAKVPPLSGGKQKSARRQKGKTCQRCKQSPCRCGHCEGCDGFEEVGPNAPLSSGEYQDQYHEQYEMLPPETTAPYQEEVLPVTPTPTPGPTSGPTPIFKMPPSAAPTNPPEVPVNPPAAPASPPAEPASVPADSANAPTARASRPAAPTSTASARTTTTVSARVAESRHVVTPIDVTVPGDEDLKLKPINFTTHAPLKPDGWEATPAAVPAAK